LVDELANLLFDPTDLCLHKALYGFIAHSQWSRYRHLAVWRFDVKVHIFNGLFAHLNLYARNVQRHSILSLLRHKDIDPLDLVFVFQQSEQGLLNLSPLKLIVPEVRFFAFADSLIYGDGPRLVSP
jgi:hypothetical protein